MRGPSGDLTEQGETLARETARAAPGSYDAFYSSPSPRAQQTALAFGAKTVKTDPRLGLLPGAEFVAYDAQVRALTETKRLGLLGAYLEIADLHPILRRKGEEVLDVLREIARDLPRGSCALAISHGGTIEPAVLVAMGGAFSLEAIGMEFSECEGATFEVDEDKIKLVELLRLRT
ncbi:MAG: histidine phosphatase family protein [Planctomycetota bacterium]|nr:histidine phosphatase family protein [Planctomycetota bacterium]